MKCPNTGEEVFPFYLHSNDLADDLLYCPSCGGKHRLTVSLATTTDAEQEREKRGRQQDRGLQAE